MPKRSLMSYQVLEIVYMLVTYIADDNLVFALQRFTELVNIDRSEQPTIKRAANILLEVAEQQHDAENPRP